MNRLTAITSEYQQEHAIQIDGSDVLAYLTLEFKPNHNCWFYTLTWGDFSVTNDQLVHGLNVLRQWWKIIPFGMVVLTNSRLDPLTLDAFSTGEAAIYITTAEENASTEEYLYG